MTIDLPNVLRLFLSYVPGLQLRDHSPLDLRLLGPRGLADLNLPGDVTARLTRQAAEELRRRALMR